MTLSKSRNRTLNELRSFNASIISIAIALGTFGAAGYNFYLALQTAEWQYYGVTIADLVLSGLGLAGFLLGRRGKHEAGIQLIVNVGPILFVAITVMLGNVGLILGIGCIVIAVMTGPLTLSENLLGRSTALAVMAGMLCLLIDRWLITVLQSLFPAISLVLVNFRLPTPISYQIFITVPVGLIVLLTGILMLIQPAMQTLRARLVIALILVSTISAGVIAVVSITNTRSALSNIANQTLLTAAKQTAAQLDNFLSSSLRSIETEALLPSFANFLNLPANQRTTEQQAEIVKLLNSLKSKETRGNLASTQRYQYIQSYMLLDVNGRAVAHTNASQIGQDFSTKGYFQQAKAASQAYVSPVLFSSTGQASLYFSARVNDAGGNPVGVLVEESKAVQIIDIAKESNNLIGDTQSSTVQSYPVVVDENHLRLAQGNSDALTYRLVIPPSTDMLAALQASGRLPNLSMDEVTTNISMDDLELSLIAVNIKSAFTFMDPVTGERLLASATKLTNQPWIVAYVQPETIFLQPVERQVSNIQLLAILIAGISAVSAILLARGLITPVVRLTRVAEQVALGDLNARAEVVTNDEVGTLANTLNNMTSQLQQTLNELEQRVTDRTRDLERKSSQLQTAAEVGHAASGIHDLDLLLPQMAGLIGERFGFYHVGIFLLDESGKYAVLRASNSEGGQRMLARGHRLAIGQQGIVGYVTSERAPRIASDVGQDAIFFNNPDLPLTRSEAALPLIAGEILVGALDVQSTESNAFTDENIKVLQVLTDLIAVAIENARLFASSQAAIEATRRAYGEVSRVAWIDQLKAQTELGYRSSESGTVLMAHDALRSASLSTIPETSPTMHKLSIPIKVRDTVIGLLDTQKPIEQGNFSEEELEILTTAVDQLGIALESARLYDETQRRVAREQLTGQITSHMRETLDIQTILQTAVRELGQALGGTEVAVCMGTETLIGNQPEPYVRPTIDNRSAK